MFRLNEEKLKKLCELEEWDVSQLEEYKKNWIEDPIYVWGGKDEKIVKEEFREKGYKWEDGVDLDDFDPGWTWGYPVVIFVEKGGLLSYSPVDLGRETEEEPSLD